MKNKKIHLISLGCPKNLVDSEMLLGAAAQEGWEIAEEIQEARLLVVSTCGFIREARRESAETILECLHVKQSKKDARVVVAGCMAGMGAREMEELLPFVDHVVGTGEVDKFRSIVSDGEEKKRKRRRRRVLFPNGTYPRLITGYGHSTYVKIGDGCSRRCAFCLIPAIRGRSQSRKPEEIVEEVRELASLGVKEVVLVSQDTTSYGRDIKNRKVDLFHLLEALAAVEGISWIRVLYLYPHESLRGLFDLLRRYPRIVPYMDLPIQHSSDRMLRIMKRGYTRRLLEDLISEAREKVPGLTIRTTILVGHPGETEREFEDLLQFIRRERFEKIGIMKYSDEEGSSAFDMKGKVGKKELERRFRLAVDEASRVLAGHLRGMVGKECTVMLDARAGRRGGRGETWYARLPSQAPDIDGHVIVSGVDGKLGFGSMVKVKITSVSGIDLRARCQSLPCQEV